MDRFFLPTVKIRNYCGKLFNKLLITTFTIIEKHGAALQSLNSGLKNNQLYQMKFFPRKKCGVKPGL
jgi:hypothetical protein